MGTKVHARDEMLYSKPPLEWDTSFCPFSVWNLDQIWHPMGVLKSACRDNLKRSLNDSQGISMSLNESQWVLMSLNES